MSCRVRNELNISPDYNPWDEQGHASRGVPPSQRMREFLNISWASRKPRQRTFPWFCDLSRCVGRSQGRASIPCITTGSLIFDFEREQALGPTELLALQGVYFRGLNVRSLTENSRKGIQRVGEGFFAPDVGTFILALFLNPNGPYLPPKA